MSNTSNTSNIVDISIHKNDTIIPSIIFIVPYRDREEELKLFRKGIENIMKKYKEKAKYMIIHQCDTRNFNRGAMKNIGFNVIKELYPLHYSNISIVFHDVDISPTSKCNLHYETTSGTVKHFYGYQHTLGGILSINAGDFEKINGFPNFWTWGYEDNVLQKRIQKANITIDRNNFLEIKEGEKNIKTNLFVLTPGEDTRIVSKQEALYAKHQVPLGLSDLHNVKYTINNDNFINVTDFETKNKIPEIQKKYTRGNQHQLFNILGLSKRRKKTLIFE